MNNYIYIGIMALITLSIRILPLTLIRRQIKNQFIRSFLYYVPYVTLAVMTFPAIIKTTRSPLTGTAALLLGMLASWKGLSLFSVAILCCTTVFILELFI